MIETIVVTSIDQVYFSKLFADSYAHSLDNFMWPNGIETYEDRERYLRSHIAGHLSGPAPEGGIWFSTKMVIDGLDVGLSTGRLENGIYEVYNGLIGTDANGSRAWVYSKESKDSMNAVRAAAGATRVDYQTIPNGSQERFLRTARAAQRIERPMRHGLLVFTAGNISRG